MDDLTTLRKEVALAQENRNPLIPLRTEDAIALLSRIDAALGQAEVTPGGTVGLDGDTRRECPSCKGTGELPAGTTPAEELAEAADRMELLTKRVKETRSLADAGELAGAISAYKDALARYREGRGK